MTRALLIAAGLAAAALVAVIGVQHAQLAGLRVDLAAEKAGRERDRGMAASAAAAAQAEYRAVEQRRAANIQEAIHATQPALDAARAAAARVPDLDRRVRDATAALAACRGRAASDPAAAAGSAPAEEAAGVLSELQRSAQEAEASRARYADEAGAAAERCERIHDALSGAN